ncbi:MAG: acetolactate decarboxylase [Bacteroidota bacterium]
MLFLFLSCGQRKESNQKSVSSKSDENVFLFRSEGSRLQILDDGDLSGTILLDSLKPYSDLYAIGPLKGLKGEVTIYNGEAHIASLVDEEPFLDHDVSNKSAIFLAYSNVNKWITREANSGIISQDDIESFLTKEAEKAGISSKASFPFRIEGEADSLVYHVIFKEGDEPHNRKEHHKSKKRFVLKSERLKIIGFYVESTKEGIFTHKGKRIHLHFVNEEKSTSGHIDQLFLAEGAKIYLPSQLFK